eukprot:15308109-Heterocapsa_arctica.AAC.1
MLHDLALRPAAVELPPETAAVRKAHLDHATRSDGVGPSLGDGHALEDAAQVDLLAHVRRRVHAVLRHAVDESYLGALLQAEPS